MRRQAGEGDQERDDDDPAADTEHRGEDACDQADERESREHSGRVRGAAAVS